MSSAAGASRAVTSDLTFDEVLLLHSIGWEPVDLVWGVSVMAVPAAVWRWASGGEIGAASEAHGRAVADAASAIVRECGRVDGHGVVGVHVDVEISSHVIEVSMVGTAVHDTKAKHQGRGFASDLSARDFCLLNQAGWAPVGLAFGSSFVYAPRRSAATAMQQKTQNVELTNMTEAMYAAREAAMGRMQDAGAAMGATGIVAVRVTEGPMPFAKHAIGFAAWGTGVQLVAGEHRRVQPQVVLPLDDATVTFDAASLRGD